MMKTKQNTWPRVLRLTLKKKWFDMIASGEKCEEYRRPSKWIMSRLEGKSYDFVQFRNGYGANAPMVECHYGGWARGYGKKAWGAPVTTVIIIFVTKVSRLGSSSPCLLVSKSPRLL